MELEAHKGLISQLICLVKSMATKQYGNQQTFNGVMWLLLRFGGGNFHTKWAITRIMGEEDNAQNHSLGRK